MTYSLAQNLIAQAASLDTECRAAGQFFTEMASAILIKQDLDAMERDAKVPMTLREREADNAELDAARSLYKFALERVENTMKTVPVKWLAVFEVRV